MCLYTFPFFAHFLFDFVYAYVPPKLQYKYNYFFVFLFFAATYVQRGVDDDDALSTKEEEKPDRDLLTDFQQTKLTHFFRHVLDMNHDDVISAADFVALNQVGQK